MLTEVNQTFHKTVERDEYSRQRNVLLLEKMRVTRQLLKLPDEESQKNWE